MNNRTLLTIAALAGLAATAARADLVDPARLVTQFQSTRSRAEVQAEAVETAKRMAQPAGMRAQAPMQSGLDARQLRLEAADAVHRGATPHGEAG